MGNQISVADIDSLTLKSFLIKAFNDLNMTTSYPSLAPLPPSVTDIKATKMENVYGNSLKHQHAGQDITTVCPNQQHALYASST